MFPVVVSVCWEFMIRQNNLATSSCAVCGFCQREQIIFLFRSGGRQEIGGRRTRKRADRVVRSLWIIADAADASGERRQSTEPFFSFNEIWPSHTDYDRRTRLHDQASSIPSCFTCGKCLRLPRNRHFYFVLDVEQTCPYRVHKNSFLF